MTDILDLHNHTIASGHAYNTLYEMIDSAAEKGIALLGISDHAPKIPGACHPFHFINFKVVPREIHGVKLLLGCELNILDYEGNVDLKPIFLNSLDYAIASIHEPCYDCGTTAQNTDAYLGALKNPAVQIIGHPDDARFPIDYDTLTAAAKEHNKLLEVNASSLEPSSRRFARAAENYRTMLERCMHYQTSIIINSDAHCEYSIGMHDKVHEILEELKFPEELVVNASIDRLRPYIAKINDYWQ